jgi:predicted esterase
MVPVIPETLPDPTRKHIFMSSGIYDPIVSKKEAERLFGLFKNAGPNISFSCQESGHE